MSSDKHWLPTPEICSIYKRFYEEIAKLRKQRKIDPITNPEDHKTSWHRFCGQIQCLILLKKNN